MPTLSTRPRTHAPTDTRAYAPTHHGQQGDHEHPRPVWDDGQADAGENGAGSRVDRLDALALAKRDLNAPGQQLSGILGRLVRVDPASAQTHHAAAISTVTQGGAGFAVPVEALDVVKGKVRSQRRLGAGPDDPASTEAVLQAMDLCRSVVANRWGMSARGGTGTAAREHALPGCSDRARWLQTPRRCRPR